MLLTTNALAFEIYPKNTIHEWITARAAVCAKSSSAPKHCSPEKGSIDTSIRLDFSAVGLGPLTVGSLTAFVKWPDDPTRQVRLGTIAKFGAAMKIACLEHHHDLND